MQHRPREQRQPKHAVVEATQRLSPELIRLTLRSEEMVGVELPFADHYIKLQFPSGGERPVTRTYTIRSGDPATGTFDVDFVVHGREGLAGPWAEAAEPGAQISFGGPGGAWSPGERSHVVFAGDEAAAPAICRGIELLPEGATATAYLEVAGEDSHFEVPTRDGVEIRWVHRGDAPYGRPLAEAVRADGAPEGAGWFVHGVAEMVKDLRRFLFVEQGVPKEDVSISGYWRTGLTEDRWQATKRDFVAEMEAEETAG